MRILAIDIGTGTQDILLFDSESRVENCPQMVMPSPTSVLSRRISEATMSRVPLFLWGSTMGGGPGKRALSRHIKAGLEAYATPEAALTFNDDLEKVREMGVRIVTPDEKPQRPDLREIEMKDLYLSVILDALASMGVDPRLDALAVAVLDHGFAPPGVSNRKFRFDHLRQRVSDDNRLPAFAFTPDDLPFYLTRMKAVVESSGGNLPMVMLDTGFAAAMGTLMDPEVERHSDLVTVNAGNSHTIAFHLHGGSIMGLFEHHTGMLDAGKLTGLIDNLVKGGLEDREVYDDGGHGAFVLQGHAGTHFVAITGPQRAMAKGSAPSPYAAVPFGDMMLTGCYGLVRACAYRMPGWKEEIESALLSG